MKRLHLLWLLVVLFANLAVGQSNSTPQARPKLLVFGVEKLSDCADEVAAVQQELSTLTYPANWTVGVVCNQPAWDTVISIAHVHTQTGFTNLQRRITSINARKFRESPVRFRHTLAHELGHITCQCDSEEMAENLAGRLEGVANAKRTEGPDGPQPDGSRASQPGAQAHGTH